LKGKFRRVILSKLLLLLEFHLLLSTTVVNSQGYVVIECPEPWQVVFLGDTVIFSLKVKNTGYAYDSYLLEISPQLPENWTANFYAANKKVREIGLDKGQSSSLDLSVDVPQDAVLGDYKFRVILRGMYSWTTKDLTITAEEIQRKIGMNSPFRSQKISTGQSASYPIKIVNEERRVEVIFLRAIVSAAMITWEISLSQEQLTLNPKDGQWVTLSVRPPNTVKGGIYHIEVIAATEDGEAKETLQLTLEIVTEYLAERAMIECPEPWQMVSSGDAVVFSLKVNNTGSAYDSYFLEIYCVEHPPLPQNWTANFYAANKKVREIGLDKGQSSNLVLSIDVPEDAASGDYNFRVNLIGEYSHATQALTITVEEILRKIEVICPFKSQTTLTGQSMSYLIKISNEGKQTEKVFLRSNVTAALMTWDISFSQEQLALNPKEYQWVKLDVRPPEIVKKGTYPIEVIAATEDGKVNASLQLLTGIIAQYLLEIVDIQPINPQVATGDKIQIVVTVRNMGLSFISRVRLNVNSTAISNILVTPIDILAMEPKQSANFYVRISPDIGSTTGDYLLSIQAVSDENRSSIRIVPVSVVSSIPWFWITICITVIATALAVIAIQKIASKHGIKIRRKP